MKKRLFVLIIGILLIGSNIFAAEGDFTIDGKVGIGTTTPRWGFEIRGYNYLIYSLSDMNHGMIDYSMPTDIYGFSGFAHPDWGGMVYAGISEEKFPGAEVLGIVANNAPAYTAGAVHLRGLKANTDGTFYTRLGDDETVVGIDNGYSGSLFRVMGDGRLWSVRDNKGISFGLDEDARIYWDGANLVVDTEITQPYTGLLYVEGEVSATKFTTRTPKLDSYNADFLTKLNNPDRMLDFEGKLDRAELLDGEAVMISIKDKDNCTQVYDSTDYCWFDERSKRQYCLTDANGVPKGFEYTEVVKTREECGTKQKEGMSVDALGMNNRLLISELKQNNLLLTQEIDLIKEEMCKSLGKFCSNQR